VSRGRKAHLVLKAGDEDNGDEDDGDDLARRYPISFSVYLLLLWVLSLSLRSCSTFFFLVPSLFFSKRFGQMERNTFASNVSPCSCIRVVLHKKSTMLGELIQVNSAS
jgi:hypothetical protein